MKKVISLLIMVAIVLSLSTQGFAFLYPKDPLNPTKTIALYYGWPSAVNNLGSNEAVAQMFSKYDLVIFGSGLEATTHLDHNNMVAIIQRMKQLNTDIEVFGYIALGTRTNIGPGIPDDPNFTLTQIGDKVLAWKNSGATGIFYDEYGYDYKVDRTRQNACITLARNQGMNIIANSWNYQWVFNPYDIYLDWIDYHGNPTNIPTLIGPNDYYLFENGIVAIDGNNQEIVTWRITEMSNYTTTNKRAQYGTKSICLDGITSNYYDP